jgi:hypothetical protein
MKNPPKGWHQRITTEEVAMLSRELERRVMDYHKISAMELFYAQMGRTEREDGTPIPKLRMSLYELLAGSDACGWFSAHPEDEACGGGRGYVTAWHYFFKVYLIARTTMMLLPDDCFWHYVDLVDTETEHYIVYGDGSQTAKGEWPMSILEIATSIDGSAELFPNDYIRSGKEY